ncbi:GABA permease [Eremomyces bilateralis CBS 781.70]|uniref:GABA permease n=1 Tax=Eremomyces bilateralis CBS 781.70 TaxID=1392243 RepID=A0A6G1GEG7_9PEZI|nr:GABA permease [Eremomyces bilateralis CBS 781.70]KAF1816260.1 GABA permease [Eremomyces bilateralis CBS 781.70]
MSDNKSPFQEGIEEDAVLEQFGYQQELKRHFSLLGMVGFSFSIVTSWTALGGVLIIGVESGGPPVMIWSWVGVSILSLAVGCSLAEMCSKFPLAGGQYSWVAILAPKSVAKVMSYICGWFMLIGILAMGAVNNFVGANFILGLAALFNEGYVIERWHTVLLTWLICIFAGSVNLFATRLLDKISKFILVWNISSFVIVVITILTMQKDKQPASFVFTEFHNSTGFNPAFAAIIGVVQALFGLVCYDAPSKMTEELMEPRRQAPHAIIWSVCIGAFTGFIFLVSLCFCMGDIEATANSVTGSPLIQIFYDSTGSKAGAGGLTSLIVVIVVFCANSLLAEGSRAVWAFSRDRGLPFSGVFSRVSSTSKIPVNAILLTMVVQAAFNAIYFGNLTGFETVITISTEGFYVSYALPMIARLLSVVLHGTPEVIFDGPFRLPRALSIFLNVAALVYVLFGVITFNLPTVSPVDADNMNYTPAAIGAIMLIAGVNWFWLQRGKREGFRGPDEGRVMSVIEGSALEPSQVVASDSATEHKTK